MRLSLSPLAWILAASIGSGEVSFFQPSVRSPRQSEIIYFLLPDRFNDGNPANNEGEVGPRIRVDLTRLIRTFFMAEISRGLSKGSITLPTWESRRSG